MSKIRLTHTEQQQNLSNTEPNDSNILCKEPVFKLVHGNSWLNPISSLILGHFEAN